MTAAGTTNLDVSVLWISIDSARTSVDARPVKARATLIPLAVLLVTVTCLFLQHRSVTAMERDIAALQTLLAAPPAHATPAPAPRPEPIRWGQLTGKWPPDLWDRLRRQIAGMTKEEMIAALNEIAALDISRDLRRALESMFLEPLAAMDPELALTRFCGQFKTDRREEGSQQAKIFHQWAKQDLAAATAWFERQLAAGTFDPLALDGSSPARINFEGALVRVLLSSDPAAAARRMAAMSKKDRVLILWCCTHYTAVPEANQATFVRLAREQVPAKDVGSLIASQAMNQLTRDSTANVLAYLDRIQATPAERAICVVPVASDLVRRGGPNQPPDRAAFDRMREWVQSQTPDRTETITGQILAKIVRTPANDKPATLEFAAAAALALEYRQLSDNDDVLCAFLTDPAARYNIEQARQLAAHITDPARREEILNQLK